MVMGEYGRIVGGSSGSGRGGGGGDLTVDIMATVQDILDQIAAQPPELLVAILAVVVVGGLLVLRR